MVAESISVETIVRRRKRRWLRFWLIWPVLALLGAAGGYSYYQGQTTAAAPQYATTAAATGAITVKISAVGTVQPIDQVNISATISGIVSTVNARINDTVKKGDLLASLDTSALEAELARDKASLSSQEAKLADAAATDDDTTIALNRAQTLTGKGLAAQDTLTTAQTAKRRADAGLASASADIEVAKADVQLSQSNLEKARIYAPMDGMVLDRNVEVGQTVSASAVTLFQLAHDLGLMQLQVDVDEADIGKVAVGNAASFTVDAYQGQIFPAKVSEMHYAPQTVDGVVTYRTILTIDNSDLKLRPGMTASADITVQEVKEALVVPNSAFRYSPPIVTVTQRRSGLLGMIFPASGPGDRQRTSVSNAPSKEGSRNLWVLKDGAATEVSVKTGVTDGTTTQVLDGSLAVGDAVITSAKGAK